MMYSRESCKAAEKEFSTDHMLEAMKAILIIMYALFLIDSEQVLQDGIDKGYCQFWLSLVVAAIPSIQ